MNTKHRRLFQANNHNAKYFFVLSTRLLKTLKHFGLKPIKSGLGYTLISLWLGLSSYTHANTNNIYQIIETSATQAVLMAHPDVHPENINIQLTPLHPTIASKLCNDLQFQTQGQRIIGRLSGKISCSSPTWSAYLSYTVEVFANVVVTAEPISRGAAIQANQVRIQRADLGTLKTGYFQSIDDVIGFTTRRTLKPGIVITPYVAEPPYLVTKGEWVTIVSGSGPIRVTAAGEALKSGRYGEQIPVRNLSSNETIKAWINNKGSVTTRKSQI